MRWILFILAGFAFIDGLITYTAATTIFQQIVGFMAFILFGILFSSAGIVDAVVNLKEEIRKITKTTQVKE